MSPAEPPKGQESVIPSVADNTTTSVAPEMPSSDGPKKIETPVIDTIASTVVALTGAEVPSDGEGGSVVVPNKDGETPKAVSEQTGEDKPDISSRPCTDPFCKCAGSNGNNAPDKANNYGVNPADTPPPKLTDFKEKIVLDAKGNPSIVSAQKQWEDAKTTRDMMIAEHKRKEANPDADLGQKTPDYKKLLEGYDISTIRKSVTKNEVEGFIANIFKHVCNKNCKHDPIVNPGGNNSPSSAPSFKPN